MKVLIIDDDRDFAEGTASLLELKQYDTVVALTPEEALSSMDDTVNIVLSDIKLGLMLGTDLMKEIKKKHDVPVIMITAYASTDTAIDSVKNNAFDYLLKPCDPEEILCAIKAAGEVVTKKNLHENSKTEFLNKLRAIKED